MIRALMCQFEVPADRPDVRRCARCGFAIVADDDPAKLYRRCTADVARPAPEALLERIQAVVARELAVDAQGLSEAVRGRMADCARCLLFDPNVMRCSKGCGCGSARIEWAEKLRDYDCLIFLPVPESAISQEEAAAL